MKDMSQISVLCALVVTVALTSDLTLTTGHARCPSRCECLHDLWPFPGEVRNASVVTCFDHASMINPLRLPNDTQVLILRNTSLPSELTVHQLAQLPTLYSLDLSINKIRLIKLSLPGKRRLALEESASILPTLIQLNMSRNAVRTFSSSTITHIFPALQFLSLDRNIINTLCEPELGESIELPKRLETLIFSRNRITTFKCDSAVLEGPLVTTITISHNLVSKVHNDSFLRVPNLRILDISYNRLIVLETGAFTGIKFLHRLDLSGNALKHISSIPFRSMISIGFLLFNSNPIQHISSEEVKLVNVTHLEISNMDILKSVSENAFSQLPCLETIRMSNNRRLASIAAEAFFDIPQLKVIDLRDNNLVAIDENLFLSQINSFDDSLTQLTLYMSGNPIMCDCNLKWIHTDLLKKRHLKIADTKSTRCYDSKTDSSMKLVDILDLPNECEPFVLPLFEPVERVAIAGDALFECRAIGLPKPSITWILPGGEFLSDGQCYNHVCFRNESLIVSPVHSNDGGSYECRAENTQGEFRRNLHLQVEELHIQISKLTVTSNFVKLAWNGSTLPGTSIFLLQYKLDDPELVTENPTNHYGDIFDVELGSNAHSFTLGGLHSGRTYMISLCIKRDSHVIRVSSIKVTTREDGYLLTLGIRRSYTSRALVTVLVCGIVFGCCFLYGVRVCRRFPTFTSFGHSSLAFVHSLDMSGGESSSPLVPLETNSVESDIAILNFVNSEDTEQLEEE